MSDSIPQVSQPDRPFGGQYAPECLIDSLNDLHDAFDHHWSDLSFRQEFNTHLACIRPSTQLHLARKLTHLVDGAEIYLKREDSNRAGNHFIINALGQALLAKKLNKTTVLAETGSGGHGVATALVCQRLGLDCVVYMGMNDARARPEQVKRIRAYGAKVVEVSHGGATIREAITEVLRAAVEQYETAYPLLGGSYGPRPLPMIANNFLSIVGKETKAEVLRLTGGMPDALVACAGIHSPGVGFFDPFVKDGNVRLVAIEGAGCGSDTDLHAAVLTNGSNGVYHGAHTLVLQDVHGQINNVNSAAPDLCYPGTSPLLAKWLTEGRIEPVAVADDEALLGCAILSRAENIECSIEDGHAIAAGIEVASTLSRDQSIVICIGSGA